MLRFDHILKKLKKQLTFLFVKYLNIIFFSKKSMKKKRFFFQKRNYKKVKTCVAHMAKVIIFSPFLEISMLCFFNKDSLNYVCFFVKFKFKQCYYFYHVFSSQKIFNVMPSSLDTQKQKKIK